MEIKTSKLLCVKPQERLYPFSCSEASLLLWEWQQTCVPPEPDLIDINYDVRFRKLQETARAVLLMKDLKLYARIEETVKTLLYGNGENPWLE